MELPMNKLQITPEAKRDLQAIDLYISKELKNPIAAKNVIRRITQDLRILLQFENAGPSLQEKTGYPTELRLLSCGDYIAFYKVDGNTVSVARILNGKQDYLRILLD